MSRAAPDEDRANAAPGAGSVREVFTAFLKLGLVSFGGPIAHVGYFQREFVERRQWLDHAHYAQLLALCQFLPGPASSQIGFSLGLMRAGWPGALAAFVAFTLPSALLMFAFAVLLPHLSGGAGEGALHGLKLVAVAVVAHGVLGMARRLTPDLARLLLAIAAAASVLLGGSAVTQLGAVAGGALLGPWLCRHVEAGEGSRFAVRHGRRAGAALLIAFALLLAAALAMPAAAPPVAQVAAAFYRAGALVFGGGHVVLPLLQQALVAPGWIDDGRFLSGYGAAQALPGPMFSFAAYLGASIAGVAAPALGGLVCLLAMFLPGLLLVAGVLPFWQRLAARRGAARMLAGVNAAVVGLLAAALYDPVWTSAVRDPVDVAIAGGGFVALALLRLPSLVVVIGCVTAAVVRTL